MANFVAVPNDPANEHDVDAAAVAQRLIDKNVLMGMGFTEWQRRVMEAVLAEDREGVEELAYWEPYVPPVPPSNWTKAKSWFRRVILRRRPTMEIMDRVLRDTYAPALRAQINQSSPLLDWVKKSRDCS